ncbi:hypothetical protein BDM02DRAFT_1885649 [Thelephora ganbajun]|uniref:Uncharacterized protein n=1 Tax=Thelephora ganbajun TaxID=370292 RepID=A0ACB6ZUZ3_THEGA|nr:hypothetical protein BDM02DRAFT_1885649 [Thelephora ganbajun]
MSPSSPPPTWTFLREKSLSSKASSLTVSEEVDQLHAAGSPTSPYFNTITAVAVMRNTSYRKQPVLPSATKHPIVHPTTSSGGEHQPLFLPDSGEEQGPSTSSKTPLFLPEEREEERPRRKKRRISTKVLQSRTLDDLWQPRQELPHNQQNSSPSPIPGLSDPKPKLSPLTQKYKKQSLHNKLGRKPASLVKGKNPTPGSSLTFNIQTSHHIPPPEVIEISDSDEPDSSRSIRVNQAPLNFPVSSLPTGQEVIEIMSSDAEDVPQSPQSPLTQILPPQDSFPLLAQLPGVPPPHEVENMMDIDDTIQHSPLLPSSPSFPPPVPQASLVDTIERTLSNVTVSSSPTLPTYSFYASESVGDSEPEKAPLIEDTHNVAAPQATLPPPVGIIISQNIESDDDFHPPPPPSLSSLSHHTPLSGHPIPTVRHLLYGGPNGIFRDANASIVQHIQGALPQNPILHPLTLPPNACLDGETETSNCTGPISSEDSLTNHKQSHL